MLGTLLCPTSDTITVHTRPGGTVDVAAAPDRDLPVLSSHVRLPLKLSQTPEVGCDIICACMQIMKDPVVCRSSRPNLLSRCSGCCRTRRECVCFGR